MITVIAHNTAAAGAADAVRQLLARHGGATSRPNWSCCSPREAGRCPGQLCDATYDVLTFAVEIDLGEPT